ncbi:hypothetical protein RRG08_021995 [Elysia crispata]|uniref:Uncharacterized protein n=1 Tax=Elysia crispata TaxID=231223 RepID=A0AAE1AX82_9GAST|nr:hypothetical protein RRG08_021995 [Elysia crispata]
MSFQAAVPSTETCDMLVWSHLSNVWSHLFDGEGCSLLCGITDPVALVSSNQEKGTFDLISLAIVLCSFLSADLIIVQEMED